MDDQQNPIVAMAQKLRARRDLGAAIDSATAASAPPAASDALSLLGALGDVLQQGALRLNSIVGKDGITYIRLEKPLRIRLRFRGKRVSIDLDRDRELVVVRGAGLDGDYQFDAGAGVPSLINLSLLSTEAGYGEPVTGSSILKRLAEDAELPRPAHLDGSGPLQF